MSSSDVDEPPIIEQPSSTGRSPLNFVRKGTSASNFFNLDWYADANSLFTVGHDIRQPRRIQRMILHAILRESGHVDEAQKNRAELIEQQQLNNPGLICFWICDERVLSV